MAKVKIRNRHTDVVSEVSSERWDKIRIDPNWSGTFVLVNEPSIPKELKELTGKPTKSEEKKEEVKK